jgi:hypothetical protein
MHLVAVPRRCRWQTADGPVICGVIRTSMNKLDIRAFLARVLLTLPAIMLGADPVRIDVNPTHLLNPSWPAHARFHEAWLLSTGALVTCVALYFVWFYRGGQRLGLTLAAVLLGCIDVGFFIATATMPLYGGILTDPAVAAMQPGNGLMFGYSANLVVFMIAGGLIVVGWALGRSHKAPG